jgi:SAM-dependent methyltransferase
MTAVEQSERFVEIATRRETSEHLGIDYRLGSATSMPLIADATFDKVVANYVLMDIRNYAAVVRESFRVLKRGGVFVVVICHPCFSCGPGGWEAPTPDSPRLEDRFAFRVDEYFVRGPIVGVWGNFDPVTGFHRPIRDYWETFASAGFRIDGFEEPSITERGRRELSPSRVAYAQRITYSCIFRLTKP